jgi:hypothetical protein
MPQKILDYATLKAALKGLAPAERAAVLKHSGWTELEFEMDSLLEQADEGTVDPNDALAKMFAMVNSIAKEAL